MNEPYSVVVTGGGDVYIADRVNQVVRKVDASTGAISTVAGGGTQQIGDGGAASSAWTNKPFDVAVDSSNNTYVADADNHRIRRISAAGTISTVAGTGSKGFGGDGGLATSAQLHRPKGVTVDSTGNVIFSDSGNHRIRKITPGGIITTIAGTGTSGFSGDGGVASAAMIDRPMGLDVAIPTTISTLLTAAITASVRLTMRRV